jgi:hypothetical protein
MLNKLFDLYSSFLSLFPPAFHFWISLILFLVIVFWLFDLVKRNIIWLLLLIILLPVSFPIVKQIFLGVLEFLKFLLGGMGA